MYDFLLPDIGEGLHEANIVKWFVNVGDFVKENDPLVEVQTDKAVVEITAPVTGTVEKLGGEEGDSIVVGELLCQFKQAEQNTQKTIQQDISNSEKKVSQQQHENFNSKNLGVIKAAPSVRKAARIAGVDLKNIVGTGPNNRITKSDLENYLKNTQSNSFVSKDTDKPTHISTSTNSEIIPILGIRKTIFENMQKSVQHAVLCTGMDKIRVDELVKLKGELQQLPEFEKVNLTYLPFILKAVSYALQKYPEFNSTVNEEKMELIIHKSIHLGVAMATPDGLMVPVIRDVNKKSIFDIVQDLEELKLKVQSKSIKYEDLQGSTFTVSSTGKHGVFATPIPKYPEVAILGAHKIAKEPVVEGDNIVVGHTMTLSCTFDHRIIDGEPAGRFLLEVAKYLEKPIRFLIN